MASIEMNFNIINLVVAFCFCIGLVHCGEYCTYFPNTYCTYGCDCSGCCSFEEYYGYADTVDTAVKAWVIAVIVVGSIIGLVIVISIIVCIVFACKGSKGSSGSVVTPIQPSGAVAVISSGGTTTTTGQWAQPAYGAYPGGAAPGPQGYGYGYGYSAPPPSYTYVNPAYPPPSAPGASLSPQQPTGYAASAQK